MLLVMAFPKLPVSHLVRHETEEPRALCAVPALPSSCEVETIGLPVKDLWQSEAARSRLTNCQGRDEEEMRGRKGGFCHVT